MMELQGKTALISGGGGGIGDFAEDYRRRYGLRRQGGAKNSGHKNGQHAPGDIHTLPREAVHFAAAQAGMQGQV